MNQQSDQRGLDQPGLAQPGLDQQGSVQRDPGHQSSAAQGPSQAGGATIKDGSRNESHGAHQGPDQGAGNGAHPVKREDAASAAAAGQTSNTTAGRGTGVRNEAVVGPFTVRDLTVFAATLVLFVASLIPMFALRYNLWNLGNLFFLGIGIVLPLVVSALFAARRLAPETKVRIGSLSVDQFASVVASFAVAFFFLSAAVAFTPVALVGLIGSLVLLAATVLARFIPFFAGDFLDRAEVPAHIMARESAAPVRKPKPAKVPKPAKPSADKPAVQGPTAGGQYAPGQTYGAQTSGGRPVGSSAVAATAGAAGAAAPAGAWPGTNPADTSPATEAAAVVPSAAESAGAGRATRAGVDTSAAEATQLHDVAVAGAAVPAATVTHTDEARAAAATPATAVHPQVQAHQPMNSQEPIGATVDPASRPEESEQQPVHEAFWFAVAQHRVAVDERTGAPLFGIEPGGWVLALEDRGDEFLVQHTDGRVGVLRDLSNIERG
ncbi:MAG: hypothetical protein M3127_04880 [Actinomycetota bacterium]|nr:hypothetical protein [Actinomycetota bacterium]